MIVSVVLDATQLQIKKESVKSGLFVFGFIATELQLDDYIAFPADWPETNAREFIDD